MFYFSEFMFIAAHLATPCYDESQLEPIALLVNSDCKKRSACKDLVRL